MLKRSIIYFTLFKIPNYCVTLAVNFKDRYQTLDNGIAVDETSVNPSVFYYSSGDSSKHEFV